MSIKLVSTGGGSVTIQEPNTASDFTLSVPSRTGTTVLQDGSNNLLMNSGYGSDAVAYGCRAWVNFNGTGTVAIRASGNVSSITDGGVGQYTVNLTTSMPDANYSVNGSVGNSDGSVSGCWFSTGFNVGGFNANQTASSFRVQVYYQTGATADVNQISVGIFR